MAGRLHYHWLPFIKYSLVLLVYIFAGGLLMFYLEECRTEVRKISKTREIYPGNVTNICHKLAAGMFINANSSLMPSYIKKSELSAFMGHCSKLLRNKETTDVLIMEECLWSWSSIRKWIKFVHNTLATIGYHEIKVQSEIGKSFVVFYSLLGVPLSVLCYVHFGRIVRVTIRRSVRRIEAHFFNRTEPRNLRHKVVLYNCVLIIIIIMLSTAIVVLNSKQWSFLECLYNFTGIISTSGNDGSLIDSRFFEMHMGLSMLVDVLQVIGIGLVSSLIQAGVGLQQAKHRRIRLPLHENGGPRSGGATANGPRRDTVNGTVAMDSLVILVRNDETASSFT